MTNSWGKDDFRGIRKMPGEYMTVRLLVPSGRFCRGKFGDPQAALGTEVTPASEPDLSPTGTAA